LHIPVSQLHPPKRFAFLAGIAALALVVAGCSPGSVTSTIHGLSANGSYTVVFHMTCGTTANSSGNNCTGIGAGAVAGKAFVATRGSGGTGDLGGGGFPANCVSAPCSQDAGVTISGSAIYGGQPAAYTLVASDPDPSTADTGTLTIGGVNYPFSCDNCVEVVMQPGSTP
jgi:hypothetical protein